MYVRTIFNIFERMRALGLIKSQREFSHVWLGMAATYLNDFLVKDRQDAVLGERALLHLEARMAALTPLLPEALRREFAMMKAKLERDASVLRLLKR